MISNYDLRQISKIKSQVSAFIGGTLELSSFIGNMDFLLNELEDIPQEWKQRVFELVIALEEVYAMQLDREHADTDAEGKRLIAEATEGIQRCLEETRDF